MLNKIFLWRYFEISSADCTGISFVRFGVIYKKIVLIKIYNNDINILNIYNGPIIISILAPLAFSLGYLLSRSI